MKKNFLLLIFTVLFLGSNSGLVAQNKCKYDSDIIDPISGERHRTVTTKLIAVDYYKVKTSFGSNTPEPTTLLLLNFHNINSKLQLELVIKFYGNLHKYNIPSNTKMNMKLNNDEIISFLSNSEVIPKYAAVGYTTLTTFSLLFDCTEKDMEKIIEGGGIKAVGTKFRDESISKIVKKKEIKKTAYRARCIISD